MELGSILEPGRPPKTDKTAILSDAVRMVTQLQNEARKLKESNEELQEKIKELKARFLSYFNFQKNSYSCLEKLFFVASASHFLLFLSRLFCTF